MNDERFFVAFSRCDGITHGFIQHNSRYASCGWWRANLFNEPADTVVTCLRCWTRAFCQPLIKKTR